ncbi:MAG: thrombospondin type 3 repeat-containing protein [Deltaproteobacteria bacterium]|nr:thrombospondin type 3 repeat-containing protein [Deltaproteobacteria bacterium]
MEPWTTGRLVCVGLAAGCGTPEEAAVQILGPDNLAVGVSATYRAAGAFVPTLNPSWACTLEDPRESSQPQPCPAEILVAPDGMAATFSVVSAPNRRRDTPAYLSFVLDDGDTRARSTKRVSIDASPAGLLATGEFDTGWLTDCSHVAADGRSSQELRSDTLGHPGSWLRADVTFDDRYPAGLGAWYDFAESPSVFTCELFTDRVVNLRHRGGVKSLTYSFDGIGLPRWPSWSLALAFPILRQGQSLYLAGHRTTSARTFGEPGRSWTPVHFPRQPSESFARVDLRSLEVDPAAHPDFSEAGEPLVLGVFLAPWGRGRFPRIGDSAAYGIDNFRVELDGPEVDFDSDGVADSVDNCQVSNPRQVDMEPNGIGDACQDDDRDSLADADDNCPYAYNPSQANGNGDQRGDACQDRDTDGWVDSVDNCPSRRNPDQMDANGDGMGDACEDSDFDFIEDHRDNCLAVRNFEQTDTDGDGRGDACDLPRLELEARSASGSPGPVFEAYDSFVIRPRYPGSLLDLDGGFAWRVRRVGSIDPDAWMSVGAVAPGCAGIRSVANDCARIQASGTGAAEVEVGLTLSVPRGGTRTLVSRMTIAFEPSIYTLMPSPSAVRAGQSISLRGASEFGARALTGWRFRVGTAASETGEPTTVAESAERDLTVEVPAAPFLVVETTAVDSEGIEVVRAHRFPIQTP